LLAPAQIARAATLSTFGERHRKQARLRELLGRSDGDARALNAALAEKLKSGPLSAEDFKKASQALKRNLQDALAVVNPTFDTSAEIE